MKFTSTAYGPPWEGIQGTGVTATGIDLRGSPHIYIIAVDPRVIPLHSRCTVNPNPYGAPAVFRAEDTGSAIKGNRIDFYMWEGQGAAREWGVRTVDVNIIGKSDAPLKPAAGNPGPGALPTRPGVEGAPTRAGESAYDYSFVIRSAARNVRRIGDYMKGAGDAIRRTGR